MSPTSTFTASDTFGIYPFNMLPIPYTVPFDVTNADWFFPADICIILSFGIVITTGSFVSCPTYSDDNSPFAFDPHPYTIP